MKKSIKIISFVLLLAVITGICSILFVNKTPISDYDRSLRKIYGVANVGQGYSTLTRLEDSIGHSYYFTRDGYVYSSFNNSYPYSHMQEITDDYGNEFIKVPKFYTRIDKHDDGTFDLLISGYKYDKFDTLFKDENGNEIEYVLIGKYEGSLIEDSGSKYIVSKKDLIPTTNLYFTESLDYCSNNGNSYHEFDYKIYNIVQQLFLIEFATTDSQRVFQGVINSTEIVKTGIGSIGDNNGLYSNAIGYGDPLTGAFNYRGIENIWGNLATWVKGIYMDNLHSDLLICTENHKNLSVHVETSYPVPILQLSPIDGTPYLGFPSLVSNGGSSFSSGFNDSCSYQTNKEAYLYLCVGGSYNQKLINSGLFCMKWGTEHYWSVSDFKTGSRLCFTPKIVSEVA